MIRTGALRDTITVYNREPVEDDPMTADVDESVDKYGMPIFEDEATPQTVRASVQPQEATEQEILQDTFVTRYNVIVQPDVEIDGTSRIEWAGKSLEVVGEPKVFSTRIGPHQIEFMAREIV